VLTSSNDVVADLLAACLDKLQVVQLVISKQKWHAIEKSVRDYECEIDLLKEACQKSAELDPKYLNEFQQLSQQQRRIMRTIFQAQQVISEDIESTNHGIQHLNKVATFSERLNI